MGIFSSTGLKRRIVAWLSTIVGFLWIIPGLPPGIQLAIDELNKLIGILGGVAVTHAVAAGTLTKKTLLTIGSFLTALVFLAHYLVALQPFLPILLKLSLIINAMAAGQTLVEGNKNCQLNRI